MLHQISATYWTLTIIAVLTAGVFGYVGGYWLKSQNISDSTIQNNVDNSVIASETFNSQINSANRNEVLDTTADEFSEIHAYTGYIREKTPTGLVLENPTMQIKGSNRISFSLENDTKYVEVKNIFIDGKPEYQETILELNDLNKDDIVTVYTRENIRTAENRFATAVERLVDTN